MRGRDERGATAIIVAGALLLLLGMAAIAVDVGAGFNERRQNQTSTDVGAMAGVLEWFRDEADISEAALDFVRQNVSTTYTDADWVTQWQACTPHVPASSDGVGTYYEIEGIRFRPTDVPTSGGWTQAELTCVAVSGAGYLYVRVPDQLLDTTFARVIGASTLQTNAWSIATVGPLGRSNVLPFGMLNGSGGLICLRSNPTGTAEPPCDGSDTGNFGSIDSPLIGNPVLGDYDPVCSQTSNQDVLEFNIANGMDHIVETMDDEASQGWPSETLDTCANRNPNTLFTDQGFGQGTEQGLVSGPIDIGADSRGRLERVPTDERLDEIDAVDPLPSNGYFTNGANNEWETRSVFGSEIDDVPLWAFLLPSLEGSPQQECRPSSYPSPGDDQDDTTLEFEMMIDCLAWGDSTNTLLFRDDLLELSPRFGYTPVFHEDTWPTGAAEPRHIDVFAPVFIQTLWFGTGNTVEFFSPGEDYGSAYNGNKNLRQLSAFRIPVDVLPERLSGDPLPEFGAGEINPFSIALYR